MPITDLRKLACGLEQPNVPAGRRQGNDSCDRAVPVHDDNLPATLDCPKVLGESVLELGDLHLSHG